MKKTVLFLCILTIFSLNIFAQTLSIPNGINGIATSPNGNVGIGTQTPKSTLDVQGDIFIPIGKSYRIGQTGDTGNRLRFHHNDQNAYIDFYPNLYFRTGVSASGTYPLTLTSEGNVGIGVNDPASKLFINGGDIGFNQNNELTYGIIWKNNTYSKISAAIRPVDLGDYARQGIGFFTGNFSDRTTDPVERMRINRDGSIHIGGLVTIGTITDFSKVNGYSLAVAGNILAEKVVVKLRGAWPDYVFNESYELKPLKEVETYIKANNHLMGVPSAAEVQENGIDIGEMNAILLKKMEEMTLYMINLQNQLDELKKGKE